MKKTTELGLSERKEIADSVWAYLDGKGIKRPEFGRLIEREKSTVDKFFIGSFSQKLLTHVEVKLGRSFSGRSTNVAPPEWGAYVREGCAIYEGTYLTIRKNYASPTEIWAYVTRLEWNDIANAFLFNGRIKHTPKMSGNGLIFREERRSDPKYTHSGQVWIPPGNYLYLVSAYGDGRLRAAIVSQLDRDGRMMGIQLSQFNPKGAAFTPAASPIAFIKREKISDNDLGAIKQTHFLYNVYKKILADAAEGVVFY